jgi:ABC-type phosphate/phosphonate transport system ATPase subunit
MVRETQQVLDRLGARFKAAQRAAHLSAASAQRAIMSGRLSIIPL